MMITIKFEKTNCEPCKQIDNLFKEHNYKPTFTYDAYNNPDKAKEYKIRSVPTILILNDKNEEVNRIVGYKYDMIKELILDKQ